MYCCVYKLSLYILYHKYECKVCVLLLCTDFNAIFFCYAIFVFLPHYRAPLKLLCDNMKNQIISRAFYGCMYCICVL